MSVYCGKCGTLIHVSRHKDWVTDEHTEMSCTNPNCAWFGGREFAFMA